MPTINLEDTYKPESAIVKLPVSEIQFYAPQRKGNDILMFVRLSPHPDKNLPNVYNLALGPLDEKGVINDNIRLNHTDTGKVFSTAILFAYTFLLDFPDFTVGLDGSDDTRATLYHSMFKSNRKHLDEFFFTIGVDWYVKLLRNRRDIERKKDGSPLFKPRPEPFDYSRTRYDLYRYYMFHLRS